MLSEGLRFCLFLFCSFLVGVVVLWCLPSCSSKDLAKYMFWFCSGESVESKCESNSPRTADACGALNATWVSHTCGSEVRREKSGKRRTLFRSTGPPPEKHVGLIFRRWRCILLGTRCLSLVGRSFLVVVLDV